MSNAQTYNASCCPRCRTQGQNLGSGHDAESTWYLCPTCRHAWQKKAVETARLSHDVGYVAFPLVARL